MDLPIIVKRLALSCEIFLQQNVKSDLFKPIKKIQHFTAAGCYFYIIVAIIKIALSAA